MRVAIVVFPGTNCDYDTKYACDLAGVSSAFIWHKETKIPKNCDLIILPGGFSYGDALRSGSIARFSPVMNAVIDFANRGGRVLGICNGFQILLESGLLPGAMKRNENLHFVSKFHHIKVVNANNDFLKLLNTNDILNIPIAHGEGNYYVDSETLKSLYDNEQVLLTYCDRNGEVLNPNGSIDAIAGICNKEKNVYALMPHPERAMEKLLGSDDGVSMMKGFFS